MTGSKKLKLLSVIEKSEPQSAYSAFVGGFKGKLIYTIPSLGELLKPLEDVICFNFIPAISGGHLYSDNNRILLSLSVKFGGLAISLFHNDAKYENENSRKLTSSLTQLIKDQYQIYSVNKTEQKSIKSNIKINKEERYKATLTKLQTRPNKNQKRLNDIAQEKRVSNWLKVYPISDKGYDLNNYQFWDCVCLRYGWRLTNIPSTCSCGSKMDIQHAKSCKKGRFITGTHNNLRDLSAKLLTELCKDVDIKPQILPVTGENSPLE